MRLPNGGEVTQELLGNALAVRHTASCGIPSLTFQPTSLGIPASCTIRNFPPILFERLPISKKAQQ
jgi:hypothetical protein